VIPWVVPLIWNTNAALSRSIAQAGLTTTEMGCFRAAIPAGRAPLLVEKSVAAILDSGPVLHTN
jgi:hypothetical protein